MCARACKECVRGREGRRERWKEGETEREKEGGRQTDIDMEGEGGQRWREGGRRG